MKKIIVSIFALMMLLYSHSMFAQGARLSNLDYGVWDRGDGVANYNDPMFDYITGIETGDQWSNIQKKGPDKFDFSVIQDALNMALKYNKKVKISIGVGPETPMWAYDHGVPMVKAVSEKPEKHAKFPQYPYYLDDNYKKYYYELIKQFSLFLRNQPENIFNLIAFVQVKTGATGDESPYKGVPIEEKYKISKKDWENFRYEAFGQFKKYFNDVDSRPIVLIFNSVDPEKLPEAYNWVVNNIDPKIGFGIKGGAYNRGHHLSDERTYKEKWYKYLVNPKGMKLFSAAEMDQSWQKPIFKINTELGFYWATLSGLNVGLSICNISKSAIDYSATHPEIVDIFRMYTKYAQQVYPQTATAAYSVFHEGLNSADTEKFPVDIYGAANQRNIERYQNICKAYASKGARMDDVKSATIGQVDQREFQTGYNDAGWEIEPGNYERFLYQINPDQTSIGLFRVRGEIDAKSSKYDRFARSFENSSGKNAMYFKFDDDMFAQSKPKSLKFTITWLDKNKGSKWAVKYNKGAKTAIDVVGKGDNQWKQVEFEITDMNLTHSGAFGSDFTLVNSDTTDDIFNGIQVDIIR